MEYYILKPKNLDLELRLEKYPPNFKFKIEYAYLIINDIITQTAYAIDRNLRKEDIDWQTFKKKFTIYFVRLCSSELQKFEREYNKHLNYLYENIPAEGNVIWKDNYSEERCYGYQLSKHYFLSELELYKLSDSKLISKLRKADRLVERDRVKKNYQYLKKFFNPNRLTIDILMAMETNDNLYQSHGERHKYFINAIKIIDIYKGNYHFSSKPHTDGRFHSSITVFPKEFRKFLRYDNKKLAEVDISASIPFFLYFLMKNQNQNNILNISIIKHLNNILLSNKSFYNPYMLVKDKYVIDLQEIDRFGDIVVRGDFYRALEEDFASYIDTNHNNRYDYLINETGRIFGRPFDGDVEDFVFVIKQNILSMMNAKPNILKIEEAIFYNRYPTISNFLKAFKRTKYITDRHKKFSHLMLQTESYFMVNLLPKRIFAKFKNRMPIFTLHDCLITTVDMVDSLESFMKNFFLQELGMIPKLKKKNWE